MKNGFFSNSGGGGGLLFCTILKYPFLVANPKNVSKAPLAPISTYFEEEVRAEETRFFGHYFFF